ncbi:MAG TPA: sigma-70 family RNA polymerase sigma factor [Candidatus Acidoferrales bacterium]|nr:sigma-70 family RNA polymerase sigma factor [Candidatus Acidoferrales bacterium]
MASGSAPDVTQLLVNWSHGDQRALEQLMPLVYGELRRLAGAYLRRERSNHTLQSTALVHEAFLRLVNQQDVQWRNRAHFYGIAAQMIRRILVDYARGQHAEKRGAGAVKLVLDEAMAVPQQSPDIDLLSLNDALDRLTELDERQSRVVELRFFAGLSIEETAEVMHLSPASIKREWQTARAWLFREMSSARET